MQNAIFVYMSCFIQTVLLAHTDYMYTRREELVLCFVVRRCQVLVLGYGDDQAQEHAVLEMYLATFTGAALSGQMGHTRPTMSEKPRKVPLVEGFATKEQYMVCASDEHEQQHRSFDFKLST